MERINAFRTRRDAGMKINKINKSETIFSRFRFGSFRLWFYSGAHTHNFGFERRWRRHLSVSLPVCLSGTWNGTKSNLSVKSYETRST